MNENKKFPERPKIISVCGAAEITPEIYKLTEKLGMMLAKEGYIIACGGLMGVMEAVAKGASSVGGITIGILPSYSKNSANPYIKIPIPTGIGEARNTVLVSMADAVVTIGGGAGTLSEMALAWKLGKIIVSLRYSGGWSEELAGVKIDLTRTDRIHPADNCEEVINIFHSKGL